MKELLIGDSAMIKVVATDEIVRKIANVSGDDNPVHLDDHYAEQTIFKKRIAHGLFLLNGISKLLGTVLPGEGTILISQSVNYKLPVYIDDCIEIKVCVKDIKRAKNIYIMDTVCTNQNEKVVLEGESIAKWEKQ